MHLGLRLGHGRRVKPAGRVKMKFRRSQTRRPPALPGRWWWHPPAPQAPRSPRTRDNEVAAQADNCPQALSCRSQNEISVETNLYPSCVATNTQLQSRITGCHDQRSSGLTTNSTGTPAPTPMRLGRRGSLGFRYVDLVHKRHGWRPCEPESGNRKPWLPVLSIARDGEPEFRNPLSRDAGFFHVRRPNSGLAVGGFICVLQKVG